MADPNEAFFDKTKRALRDLCEKAKTAQELHFAMALVPEIRGMQDAGWNTALEAMHAYDQYKALLESIPKNDVVRIRVILAFYLQVAEASGFYEMPKRMMLTLQGGGNNINPFLRMVRRHEKTGRAIDPNANRIMKDLMGHAYELGLTELWEVFKNAFDPDIRNAVAHANYVLAKDGMRLRKRSVDQPRLILWEEFDTLIARGLHLFAVIREIVDEYKRTYAPPKTIKSRLAANEPLTDYTIFYDPADGSFGWITGTSPPAGYGKGKK